MPYNKYRSVVGPMVGYWGGPELAAVSRHAEWARADSWVVGVGLLGGQCQTCVLRLLFAPRTTAGTQNESPAMAAWGVDGRFAGYRRTVRCRPTSGLSSAGHNRRRRPHRSQSGEPRWNLLSRL